MLRVFEGNYVYKGRPVYQVRDDVNGLVAEFYGVMGKQFAQSFVAMVNQSIAKDTQLNG